MEKPEAIALKTKQNETNPRNLTPNKKNNKLGKFCAWWYPVPQTCKKPVKVSTKPKYNSGQHASKVSS